MDAIGSISSEVRTLEPQGVVVVVVEVKARCDASCRVAVAQSVSISALLSTKIHFLKRDGGDYV